MYRCKETSSANIPGLYVRTKETRNPVWSTVDGLFGGHLLRWRHTPKRWSLSPALDGRTMLNGQLNFRNRIHTHESGFSRCINMEWMLMAFPLDLQEDKRWSGWVYVSPSIPSGWMFTDSSSLRTTMFTLKHLGTLPVDSIRWKDEVNILYIHCRGVLLQCVCHCCCYY